MAGGGPVTTRNPDAFAATHPDARACAYAALAERAAVHEVPMPGVGSVWLVTEAQAVRQVLTDDRPGRAPSPARAQAERVCPDLVPALYSHMVHASGHEHTRVRRTVAAAF